MHIVNIYSPCNLQEKRVLWDSVSQLKNQNASGYWFILGDFNNIRTSTEIIGSSQSGQMDGTKAEFNDWIDDMEVETKK